MDNEAFWFSWFVFFTLIGWAVGSSRGKPLVGFLAGLLLGPIGCLLTCLGPNLREEKKKDKEKKEQQALMQQQIALQKAQLEAMQRLQSASPASMPPPPGSKRTLRIAKDGQDLGEIDIPKIKMMLQSGQLTTQDFYFDLDANEWMTLDCNPSL